MPSLRRTEGYLEIDHSASPGLPPEIARASGFDPRYCGEGKKFEAATITCSHCGIAHVKNPLRTRDRAYCRHCDHYICDYCDTARHQPSYVHLPYKQLQEFVLSLASSDVVGSPQELLSSVTPTIIVP